MITLGILVMYVMASGFSWATISALCLTVPVSLATVMLFLPESPVYLASVDRVKEARSALKFLRGHHVDVEKELGQIQESLAETTKIGTVSVIKLFTNKVGPGSRGII